MIPWKIYVSWGNLWEKTSKLAGTLLEQRRKVSSLEIQMEVSNNEDIARYVDVLEFQSYVDRWQQDPAVVNAFYNPNMNDIGKTSDLSRYVNQCLQVSSSNDWNLNSFLDFFIQCFLRAFCSLCSTVQTSQSKYCDY